MNVDLYNLTPLLKLISLGLVLLAGPLAWWWVKSKDDKFSVRYHYLTAIVVFLCFDLIVFGAFTRLTDSGLGCPDWPGCYGHASPIGALEAIKEAETAMPTGPVTLSKAWIEMIHRYLAMLVGALILVLCALAWKEKAKLSISPWWPTFTLFAVCLQGAFGAFTVTWKLYPFIVSLHLITALILLMLLSLQHQLSNPNPTIEWSEVQWPTRLVFISFILLMAQIALGAWVSTNYAVLACNTFPLCHGSLWPNMDWSNGFSLFRDLGKTTSGELLSFEALVAIHYAHRLMAYVVIAVLLRLYFKLRKLQSNNHANWLLLILGLQFLTGLSNVVLGWPLIAALLHTAGAAALVLILTRIGLSCWKKPAEFHS